MPVTRTARTTFFLATLLVFFTGALPHAALAATVTWELLPDRERAVIRLNNEEGFAGQVNRVDRKGLLLELGIPPFDVTLEKAPSGARIFSTVEPRGQALAFFTQTDAFGFVVTRPDRTTVVLDVFDDPMGKRWRPGTSHTAEPQAGSSPADATPAPVNVPVNAPGEDSPPAVASGPDAPQNPLPQSPLPGASAPSIPAPSVPSIPAPSALEAVPAENAPSLETPGNAVTSPLSPPSGEAFAEAFAPRPDGMNETPLSPGTDGPVAGGAPFPVTLPGAVENVVPPPVNAPEFPVAASNIPPAQASQDVPPAAELPANRTVSVTPPSPVLPYVAPEKQGEAVSVSGALDLPVTAVRGRLALDGTTASIVPEELGGVRVERPLSALAAEEGAHIFRAPLNTGPVDEWYAAHRDAATPGAAAGPPKPVPPPPPPSVPEPDPAVPQVVTMPDGSQITYVDAQGNPVPAPPDVETLLDSIYEAMNMGKYDAALETAEAVLNHPYLTPEQREEALHLKSELLFTLHKDDLAAHFGEIAAATETALNYNRMSPRNATALLRMGYINLQMGNTSEAAAYFNMLRSRYPMDANIPLTYHYWGDYFFNRGDFLRAADQFQYIVQNHAESPYARDAAVGLTRSYIALGYFPQAFQVVQYIESRWPRYYLEQPRILEMMGDVAFNLGNYDYALTKYWTYYNIVPGGADRDIVLTRIGDIYSSRRQIEAAREVYRESARLYPDKDGGLIALMRLAEQGVNDMPTITDMFGAFDAPSQYVPYDVYRKIIDEHPESRLVPLAQLKLAMWLTWNKQYEEAMKVASDMLARFPNDELTPRAQEVAMRAFSLMSAEAVAQGRTGQVQSAWERFSAVNQREDALDPKSRMALAYSQWQEHKPELALETVEPLFRGSKVPEYSEMALTLSLNIFLDLDLWERILALQGRVGLWQLEPATQRQLDYAVALAHENLDQSEDAVPLWTKLHKEGRLDERKMAYAEFFLSRDAERRRDLRTAYTFGFSALNRFLDMERRDPSTADDGKITTLLSSLMDITENAGRFDEALDYAHRYLERIPQNDPLRQGIQFRMSQIYRKQGNTPEWRRILTELAERDPDSFYGRTAASQLRGEQLSEEAAQFSPAGLR